MMSFQPHGCNCPGGTCRTVSTRSRPSPPRNHPALRHRAFLIDNPRFTSGLFLRAGSAPNQTSRRLHPSTLGSLHVRIFLPLHMTSGLMRRFSSSARTRLPSRSLTAPRVPGLRQYQRNITDVRPRQATVARSWFTSSSPCGQDEQEKKRLAERNLKLGDSAYTIHLPHPSEC
jgi:hypothetical protein